MCSQRLRLKKPNEVRSRRNTSSLWPSLTDLGHPYVYSRRLYRRKVLAPAVALITVIGTAAISHAPSTTGFAPVDLGIVTATNYTHIEGTWGRATASGYTLKDSDSLRVCAISRDWWRGRVMPGDYIYLQDLGIMCQALDSMGDVNENGFKQRKWIDVYRTDYDAALAFGMKESRAWLLRSGSHGATR
jgi:3D (Asp-Asp-Asp) domain-containing protein